MPDFARLGRQRRLSGALGRVLGAVAVTGVASLGALAFSAGQGCTSNACDPPKDGQNFREVKGHFVDARTWESSGFEDVWFDFPHETDHWACFMPGTPEITNVFVYLGVEEKGGNGARFSVGSGNSATAEHDTGSCSDGQGGCCPCGDLCKGAFIPNSTVVWVHNETCAEYHGRVVVTFASPASADASTDADAETPQVCAAPDAGDSGGDGGSACTPISDGGIVDSSKDAGGPG